MSHTHTRITAEYLDKLLMLTVAHKARSNVKMLEQLIDADLKRVQKLCKHTDADEWMDGSARCLQCGLYVPGLDEG